MKLKNLVLGLLAFFCVGNQVIAALPDSERIYEFSLQLSGKLGGKYAVDMLLSTAMSEEAAFLAKSGDCVEVEGWYAYHSQIKPIQLGGKYCPQNGGLMLTFEEDGGVKERFTGKWNPAGGIFTGEWLMTSNSKKLNFELKTISISPKIQAEFLASLKKEYQGDEPSMESFVVSDLGKDSRGCYLDGLKFGWNGSVDQFCSTRLEVSTDYTSTYRSSMYNLHYQLLPGEKGCVLAWTRDSNYIKEEEEEEDSSEGYSLAVYSLSGAEMENVFPAGFPSSKDFGGYSDTVLYKLYVLHDRFSLEVDGKVWKLVWDGERFVSPN